MFPSLEQAWQQSEADEDRKWGDPKLREARSGLLWLLGLAETQDSRRMGRWAAGKPTQVAAAMRF